MFQTEKTRKMSTFSQTEYRLCSNILGWFLAQNHSIKFSAELDWSI